MNLSEKKNIVPYVINVLSLSVCNSADESVQTFEKGKELFGKGAGKSFKQTLEINPANLAAFIPVYASTLRANRKEIARQYLERVLWANPNQIWMLTSKAGLEIQEKMGLRAGSSATYSVIL